MRPSETDQRANASCVLMLVVVAVGAFVWWVIRHADAPEQATATNLVSGQVVPFNPARDRVRATIEWTLVGEDECPAGAVPRLVVRMVVPRGSSPGEWLGAAEAAVKAAVRRRRYCAVMVFVTISPGKIIYGTPEAHASFSCAPGGQWDRAGEAFPDPDYSTYAITYTDLMVQ